MMIANEMKNGSVESTLFLQRTHPLIGMVLKFGPLLLGKARCRVGSMPDDGADLQEPDVMEQCGGSEFVQLQRIKLKCLPKDERERASRERMLAEH